MPSKPIYILTGDSTLHKDIPVNEVHKALLSTVSPEAKLVRIAC